MGSETMFASGAACCSVRAHPETAKPRARKYRPAQSGSQQHRKEVAGEFSPEQEHRNAGQDEGLYHHYQ